MIAKHGTSMTNAPRWGKAAKNLISRWSKFRLDLFGIPYKLKTQKTTILVNWLKLLSKWATGSRGLTREFLNRTRCCSFFPAGGSRELRKMKPVFSKGRNSKGREDSTLAVTGHSQFTEEGPVHPKRFPELVKAKLSTDLNFSKHVWLCKFHLQI